MRRRLASALIPLLILPALNAGCGGGGNDDGGSSPVTPTTVVSALDVVWNSRSRLIVGPTSALSARFTFVGASAAATDVTSVVDRRDDPNGYVATYPTPVPVRTGGTTIRIDFFSEKAAGGVRVATATTGVVVRSDGTLVRADGSPLQYVDTDSDLGAVTIVAPATIDLGATATLGFTVTNKQGQVVALSPGSAVFTSDGSVTVTPDGTATGSSLGSSTVSVNVDGLTASAAISVVRPANSGIIEITQPINDLAFSTAGVLVTTPGSGPNPNRLLVINPFDGSIQKSFALGSEPSVIGTSYANRRIVYVGLNGSGSVRRVDVLSGELGEPFSLGTSSVGTPIANDIAISPLDVNTIFVSQSGSSFAYDLVAYRNGVAAPNRISGLYQNDTIAVNETGTELYGLDTSTTSRTLTRNTVDANGLTQAGSAFDVVGGNQLVSVGNRLFASDGRVAFASTLAGAGQFASNSPAFSINASSGRAFFVVDANDPVTGQGVLQLAVYSTETYERLSLKTIPGARETGFGGAQRRLLALGPNLVVLATSDSRILFIDPSKL